MTAIVYQRSFFADLNGKPLDSGSLYIGAADQDPQTNPIQCYWDSALTIPATQPLAITSGYVTNGGVRAPVYVAATSYSLRARNKAGTQVDYIADANGLSQISSSSGSSLVGYLAGATGATARTVQAKLRDVVSVKDFGAVGDGSTDDTAAFQAAINTGKQVLVPYSASGYVVGALTATAPFTLTGDDNRTLILIKSGVTNWLTLRTSNVSVQNFRFTQGGNCTNALIYIDSAVAQYEKFRFGNIVTDQLAAPFLRDAAGAFTYDETYIRNVTLQRHAGQAVRLRNAYAFIFLDDVTVDTSGTAAPNFAYFDVRNCQGMYLTRCEVSGSAFVGSTNSTQVGFDLRNNSAMWLRACFADSCGGKGYYISGCTYVHFDDVSASLCDGIGIDIDTTTILSGNKVFGLGRTTLASKTALVDLFRISNACQNINISNLTVGYATGDNIKVDHTTANCTLINLDSINSVGATGWGVRTTGTTGTPSGAFSNVMLSANGLGDYSLANLGAGSGFERIAHAQLNSGAYFNAGSQVFRGGGATSASKTLAVQNSAGAENFHVRDDGFVNVLGSYANTTGSAANVFIGADGYLYRSTSSLKYKENIRDYGEGLEALSKLRPVLFNAKGGTVDYAGFIAEEVDAAGLREFVVYGEDGKPEALNYANMVALLTKAVQELAAKVQP